MKFFYTVYYKCQKEILESYIKVCFSFVLQNKMKEIIFFSPIADVLANNSNQSSYSRQATLLCLLEILFIYN